MEFHDSCVNVEYCIQIRHKGDKEGKWVWLDPGYFGVRAHKTLSQAQFQKAKNELENPMVDFRIVKRKTEVNEEVIG